MSAFSVRDGAESGTPPMSVEDTLNLDVELFKVLFKMGTSLPAIEQTCLREILLGGRRLNGEEMEELTEAYLEWKNANDSDVRNEGHTSSSSSTSEPVISYANSLVPPSISDYQRGVCAMCVFICITGN